jgi:16S rRNA (guanine527-N7)-methyltransferase
VTTDDDLNRSAEGILALALQAGVQVSLDAARSLALHATLVYETNAHTNLTRVPEAEAAILHVLDSLSGLGQMMMSPGGPWLDLGSGAGYPGVPLALTGGRHVDLLESVGRKAAFLERVIQRLCLNASVRRNRAEDAANETPEAYAAVSARAVAELPALVELASPLLMRHGRLVCWKGDPSTEELDRGDKVAAKTGMRRVACVAVRLPATDVKRRLVVFERIGESRVKLPRRIGLAQSKPLA